MAVDATVIWRIDDVDVAARNSAETISKGGEDTVSGLIVLWYRAYPKECVVPTD